MATPFVAIPYAYDALIAVGYAFMLPAIAVLHVRHLAVRDSGAILGMTAGVATVVVGLVASVSLDLRPGALVLLGMWWWVIGKLWVGTSVMPPFFGIVTAGLGVIALTGALVVSASGFLLQAGAPAAGQAWTLVQVVMGLWLFALAAMLQRPRA